MSFIYKYKTPHGFIKGVSGGYFVLINKWGYPQSAFTHNPPLPTIGLYPQSAFTHNRPLPTIRLYPQSRSDRNLHEKQWFVAFWIRILTLRALTVVGKITVWLASSLTRLHLTEKENMLFVCWWCSSWMQACKTGDPIREFSLTHPMLLCLRESSQAHL